MTKLTESSRPARPPRAFAPAPAGKPKAPSDEAASAERTVAPPRRGAAGLPGYDDMFSGARPGGPVLQRKGDPVGPGYYGTAPKARELDFALRHPLIARAIGMVSEGSMNISTRAARISTNDLGLQETSSKQGSEVNAFRHTLWQSAISKEYGTGIAKQVGNAHEENPLVIAGKNRAQTVFDTEALADQSADLRNNEIGRAIGQATEPGKMNELALAVIEHFHATGLWVSEKTPEGKWLVVQRRVSDATYETAKARLTQLNEAGLDPKQQAQRDTLKAEAETIRREVGRANI